MGRITGSASIETLVRVGIEKEHGLSADSKMIVLHDFTPCVDDELHVYRGQLVNVLYQENDWVYVISDNQQQEGFIPYSYCAPVIQDANGDSHVTYKKKMPRKIVANSEVAPLGQLPSNTNGVDPLLSPAVEANNKLDQNGNSILNGHHGGNKNRSPMSNGNDNHHAPFNGQYSPMLPVPNGGSNNMASGSASMVGVSTTVNGAATTATAGSACSGGGGLGTRSLINFGGGSSLSFKHSLVNGGGNNHHHPSYHQSSRSSNNNVLSTYHSKPKQSYENQQAEKSYPLTSTALKSLNNYFNATFQVIFVFC